MEQVSRERTDGMLLFCSDSAGCWLFSDGDRICADARAEEPEEKESELTW